MLKKERYFDEIISEDVVIGRPVIIRVGNQLLETSSVVDWNVGYPKTKIETQNTIYYKK